MERLWNLTKISGYKLMDKKQIRDSIVWLPPKTRNIKVNFGRASLGNPGKLGYGAIIRDKFGNFVRANYGPLGINTNNMAKMAGLVAGMEWGLVGITLNLDRHWCDALVLEAVLLPLVDIIESKERVVELLIGFLKPFIADMVGEAILGLQEDVRVSILKIYFQFENYLHSDLEEEEESEGDDMQEEEDIVDSEDREVDSMSSEEVRELASREVWREERERLKIFGDEAWEIYRCAVFNENMEPFRRTTESDNWWLLENSTRNAIAIGEYVVVIYQALGG
ncbi:hypothetical protein SUGI_1065490 [Cryptomeria japonica]|nr:hypothetical protein SUGI_1065490 [Cryptomeria japonica]